MLLLLLPLPCPLSPHPCALQLLAAGARVLPTDAACCVDFFPSFLKERELGSPGPVLRSLKRYALLSQKSIPYISRTCVLTSARVLRLPGALHAHSTWDRLHLPALSEAWRLIIIPNLPSWLLEMGCACCQCQSPRIPGGCAIRHTWCPLLERCGGKKHPGKQKAANM